jgi:arylformamidase
MRIIDITMPLHPAMPVYPGDPLFTIEQVARVEPGVSSSYSLSRLSMSTHCGTHVDAPAHFLSEGAGIDQVPLEILCGPARVIDLTRSGPAVDERALAEADLQGVERLLIKTEDGEGGAARPLDRSAHLTQGAARYLRAETTVRLLGIDTLSVEGASTSACEVHHTLLAGSAPIIIVEGLALAEVEAGNYELFCLPLKVHGADGAPARAILRRSE